MVAAFVAALLFVPGHVQAAEPRLGDFVFEGAVSAIARGEDGSLYLGGLFDRESRPTGGGLVVPAAGAGTPDPAAFPPVHGVVRAVVADGRGGWFVGGSFARVGKVEVRNLAHITAAGTVDPAFTPNPDDEVQTLTRSGGTLYLGGSFFKIGGTDRIRPAAVDTTTGAAARWAPIITGTASFDSVTGQPRHGLAAFDADTGALVGADENVAGGVHALTASGSTLFMGGAFKQVGGAARGGLAALEARGTDVRPWSAGATADDESVDAIALKGTTAYLGGHFYTFNGQDRFRLAAVDAGTGALLPWNPAAGPSTYVHTLAVAGEHVIVGGQFTDLGGQARSGLAALDPGTGAASAWDPAPNDWPGVLFSDGTNVYAGGNFVSVGRRITGPFAQLDLTAPDTRIDGDADGKIAFSADEPDVSFECAVGAGAFAPCSSPYPLPAPHITLAVRATDLSNNTDATPATYDGRLTGDPGPGDRPPQPQTRPQPQQPVVTQTHVKSKTPSRIATITFKGGYRIGSLPRARAKQLTVVVHFHGNRYLGRTTNRFPVRVPN